MPSSALICEPVLPLFCHIATVSSLNTGSNFRRGLGWAPSAGFCLTFFMKRVFYFSPLTRLRQIEATSEGLAAAIGTYRQWEWEPAAAIGSWEKKPRTAGPPESVRIGN